MWYNVCKFIVMNSYELFVLITFILAWSVIGLIIMIPILVDLFPNTNISKRIKEFLGE